MNSRHGNRKLQLHLPPPSLTPDGITIRTTAPLNPTWQWARSPDKGTWFDINGATSASYIPDATDDNGKYLRVTASYTDGHDAGKTAVGISGQSGAGKAGHQRSTRVPDN